MGNLLLFPAGTGEACHHAARELKRRGIPLCDHASPEVTHLLLDVPTREDPRELLRMLPPETLVIGGNLHCGGSRLDLLQDESYLARNAAITADCALKVARQAMDTTWADTRVLVIGWGRIGQCLARLLQSQGAQVTVASRKESHRAMASALGYGAIRLDQIGRETDVVFSTAPAALEIPCHAPVQIDLASTRGLSGEGVIWARGLPGIHAPKTAGRLIARRILELLKEETP